MPQVLTADRKELIKKHRRTYESLRDEASTWRPHWQDIAQYMLPRKGRFLLGQTTTSEVNRGDKKHQKIINGAALDAIRIISAGLQGGLTSPARPWFQLATPDKDMMEYAPVRYWLSDVQRRLLNIYSRSNFYGSVHGQYKELSTFSTAAMMINPDFKSVINCRPFTIGEYVLALDENYRVAMVYRLFAMKARQMVARWGKDNVSRGVQTAAKENNGEHYYDVLHCIVPNDPNTGINEAFPFYGVYFEWAKDGAENNGVLEINRYTEQPFVAPRWDVTGVDTYGGDCPGMDALGDCKMLQKMEEKKLKGLDKMIDPAMNAPTSMKKQGGSLISGDINYIDINQGQQSFAPAHEVRLDFQNMAFEIERVEQRIRRAFFNDLFLTILTADKRMTATEVAERHEEKLLMLGPVLERLQSEFLDVIIDRTFSIANSFDLLPPPPPELQGVELKVEYISLLAQAQKMVALGAIERTAGFVGGLATTGFPEVIHKFDASQAVDEYAESVGVPPRIIRSDEKANERAQQAAQAQQRAAALEQGQQAAQTAKTLSETERGKDSALDAALEAAGA